MQYSMDKGKKGKKGDMKIFKRLKKRKEHLSDNVVGIPKILRRFGYVLSSLDMTTSLFNFSIQKHSKNIDPSV